MMTTQALMLEIRRGFSIEMLNEEACRDWFLRKLHPDGARCPKCGQEITSEKKANSYWDMKRVSCLACGRSFSAVTGTSLHKIGIEFRALYLLLFLVTHGVRVNRIAANLGISTGAAYLWANRAKAATCERSGNDCFSGPDSVCGNDSPATPETRPDNEPGA
jgi:transposase-like protein